MTSRNRAPVPYQTSRTILLLLGLIVLTVIGGIMWIRGVEPIEVSATIFFMPLFAAIVFFGIPGGLSLGLLASIAYVVIRIPSLRVVGFEPLAGLLVARIAGYLVFGAVGGWAIQSLDRSLRKLERIDRVDDETFLSNARAFVEQVEQERSRVERYGGTFSAVLVSFPSMELDRRTRAGLMQSLGSHLRANVRSVDEITHARVGDEDLFGFVLPETGIEGAGVFVDKLTAALTAIMPGDRDYRTQAATFPPQSDELDVIIGRVRQIEERDHPVRR